MDAYNHSTHNMSKELSTSTVSTMLFEDLETSDYPPLIDSANWTDLDLIMNVTKEYPFEYASIMFGYCMPGILALTLITNTLVVAVLCQKHMRSPTNLVLVTMALVDMATLLFPSPWYFYIYTLGHYDNFLPSTIYCYLYHIMTDVIPIYFHTASIWLTLFLAFQRYIYVCHPTQAATWCTVPRVKRAIAMIMLAAFCLQVSRFIDYSFVAVRIRSGDGVKTACKMDVAQWVQRLDGQLYYTSYFVFRIVFVSIIPCFSLIVLNLLLFLALKRAKVRRKKLLESKYGPLKEQCSAVTNADMNIHRSSYQDTNAYPNILQLKSNSFVFNGQIGIKSTPKISSRRTLGFASRIVDKTRRFSTIFSDRGENSEYKSQPENRIHFSSPADQTSDTKVSCSMLSDDVACNNQDGGDRGHRSKRSQKEPSVERKDNGKCNSLHQTSKPSELESNRLLEYERHKDKNRDCTTCVQSRRQKHDVDQEGYEDDFTCHECTISCGDEELDCQRCLAIENGRACTYHQAVSQCSSLLGGATYTTTNDDLSSCAITQNASSSIYVTHDETLDVIEAASLREEEAGNTNEDDPESSLLKNRRGKLIGNAYSIDLEENRRQKSQSAKIRRQLTCGCGAPMLRPALFCHCRQDTYRDGDCKECCMAGNYEQSIKSNVGHSSLLSGSPRRGDTPRASCSNSDPNMNRQDDNNTTNDCIEDISCSKGNLEYSSLEVVGTSHVQQNQSLCKTSGEKIRDADQISISADRDHALYTVKTATQTLANSRHNGSLKQAHSRSILMEGQTNNQMDKDPTRQMKSPSFASSTGRGSRATLVGLPNQVIPGAGFAGGTATASFKTIESNRTTIMLMVVVSVFLAVEVPVAITAIIHVFLNIFDARKANEFGYTMSYIKLFTNFAIMISYSINFTIYCSMSKKFRETFRDLFSWLGRIRVGESVRRKPSSSQHQLHHSQQQHSMYNHNSIRSCNGQNNQLVSSNQPANTSDSKTGRNECATTTSGPTNNVGTMARCSPTLRRSISQQQECKL